MICMKIVKYLKESSLLIKSAIEIIENKAKIQKSGFISTLLGILNVSLLGNLLSGKKETATGWGKIRAGNGNN